MGGLVGSIFDLIQGDPTKGEENNFGTLAGFDTKEGEGDTDAASKYYQAILSGDPTQIAAAMAPEISSGQSLTQQQAKTNAEFGTRSGGTTASTQNAEGAERGNIINLEGGARSGAAAGAAGLGTNLLSQASTDTGQEATLAANNRKRLDSDVGGIATGAAQIAGGFALPGFGGGEESGPVDSSHGIDADNYGFDDPPASSTNDLYL